MTAGRIHDVIIVGAGPAGVTAALALAREGVDVIVCEGASYPGAENWSGAVYFAENLTRLLGRETVESLPYERRVVRRGLAATNGETSFELSYQENPDQPAVFEDCYTVLRPTYDRALAELARRAGATILERTTVTGLLRSGEGPLVSEDGSASGRVVGVQTERGPLFARAVFLAEGDASHLVKKEGLERVRGQTAFLHGVKEVVSMEAGAIRDRFGLTGDSGACLEILLRNPTFRGKPLNLNAGGFLYTNRDSISLGIVLPLANLKTFGGSYNSIAEWYRGLEPIAGLVEGGEAISFGAKLIRGGGIREVPHTVAHGLALGGAAAGLGVDFPYPNYTGPATASGLLFAEAFLALDADGAELSRDNLERAYVRPLSESRYWQDMEHLRDWPHYVESTRAFFGPQVDVACAGLSLLTRPDESAASKLWRLPDVLASALPSGARLNSLRDLAGAGTALGVPKAALVTLPRAIGSWFANLVLHLRPRGPRGKFGELRVRINGSTEPLARVPGLVRLFARRVEPTLTRAMGEVYRNDETPLPAKARMATGLLSGQWNILEILLLATAGAAAGVVLGARLLSARLRGLLGMRRNGAKATGATVTDLAEIPIRRDHDSKLGEITYRGDPHSHIRVFFPRATASSERAIDPARSSLWSVCPAKVYQREEDATRATSVTVLHENCVKCETCLHAEPTQVDWSRFRRQRLVYEVYSGATEPRSSDEDAQSSPDARAPWEAHPHHAESRDGGLLDGDAQDQHESSLPHGTPSARTPSAGDGTAELGQALRRATRQAAAFRTTLDSTPTVLERFHRDWLQLLARNLKDTVDHLVVVLERSTVGREVVAHAREHEGLQVTAVLTDIAQRVLTHAGDHRFFHADADACQLADWPLAATRRALRALGLPEAEAPGGTTATGVRRPIDGKLRASLEAWLDRARTKSLDGSALLDEQEPMTDVERARLLEHLARVPQGTLPASAEAPDRKALAIELGRLSPGVAILAASHLVARDLLAAAAPASKAAGDLDAGRALGAVVFLESPRGGLALSPFAVTAGVQVFVLCEPSGRVRVCPADHDALTVTPQGGIGLRAAGPGLVELDLAAAPPVAAENPELQTRARMALWRDQLAIALGATEVLAERTRDHALSRVQFPGMFRDRRGRDGIVKFGAVRAMLGGIEATRELLSTLVLATPKSATSDPVLAALHRVAGLEAAGPRPNGAAYLAGQAFGGMAYSEDDVIARFYRDSSALCQVGGTQEELARLAGGAFLEGLKGAEEVSRQEEAGTVARVVLEAGLPDDPATAGGAATAAEIGFVLALESASDLLTERAALLLQEGNVEAEPIDAAAGVFAERAREAMHRLPATLSAIPVRVWLGSEMLSAGRLDTDVPPPDAPSYDYRGDLLEDGSRYRSGDFLRQQELGTRNRLVPEALWCDKGLAAVREHLTTLFTERFRGPDPLSRKRFGEQELEYHRLLDETHQVPRDDIEWLASHGFYRTFIPTELGGRGRSKAEYYELCTASMRIPDPGVSLTIQATSSIGTTPILIGLKDLAQAEREMQALLDDPEPMTRALEHLQAGDGAAAAEELGKAIGRSRALRAMLGRGLRAAEKAAQAPETAREAALERVRTLLGDWEDDVRRALREIPRSRLAHEFFLRLIAGGRASAFALTEPSAGSDTARIRTRGEPRSVELRRDPRGLYTFVPENLDPEDDRSRRFLADLRRIEIDAEARTIHYRLGFDNEEGKLVPVIQNDFVYSKDESKVRAIEIDGEQVPIHDLALPRRVELPDGATREVYDYYEVEGAKMWITNGHIAGVFCLYARTEAGPTGMLLDGHAEGLVVGKDEEKMGQRGAPTNELTLSAVRVPMTHVIGLEGRGQENALETLNVGRTGLLVSNVAIGRDLIDDMLREIRRLPSASPASAYWLGRALEELFACDSLSANLTGLLDHPGTRDARMESAIGKYLSSEGLHRMLDWAEHAFGAAAASPSYDLEKKRRDARILNIYEGTNEVQRFLILRDLVAMSEEIGAGAPGASTAGKLEEARTALADAVRGVASAWGARSWQSVRHQPIFFKLSEAAAWLCVADAVLHRRSWIATQLRSDAARSLRELRLRTADAFIEFTAGPLILELAGAVRQELEALTTYGKEPPILRMADLALERTEPASAATHSHRGAREAAAGEAIVVVMAAPVLAPRPRVQGTEIAEPQWELDAPSRGAVRVALDLRDRAGIRVHAVAAGGARTCGALRAALAAGVDEATWIDTNEDGCAAGTGIASWLQGRSARVVLAGSPSSPSTPPPLSATDAARALGSPAGDDSLLLLDCAELDLDERGLVARGPTTGDQWLTLPGSARVTIATAEPVELEPASAARQVHAERAPIARVAASELETPTATVPHARRFALPSTAAPSGSKGPPPTRSPEEAAGDLRVVAALDDGSSGGEDTPRFDGAIRRGDSTPRERQILVIANPDEMSSVLPAARALARATGRPLHALLWMPRAEVGDDDDENVRVAVGRVLADENVPHVSILDDRRLTGASTDGEAEAMTWLLDALDTGSITLAGHSLAAAASIAGTRLSLQKPVRLVSGARELFLSAEAALDVTSAACGGRLRVTESLSMSEAPLVVITAGEGELSVSTAFDAAELDSAASDSAASDPKIGDAHSAAEVTRLTLPRLTYDAATDAIAAAIAGAKSTLELDDLTSAEFIIDIGYGVGTADGLEAVLEPLESALTDAGVPSIHVGATRKVTQDLGLLPDEHQIGQTGVSVRPRVLLALGVSGAPQHLGYIGEDAVIFAFNKDSEAPLMTLGQRQARPRVFPIPGDLFEMVPRFVEALRREPMAATEEEAGAPA